MELVIEIAGWVAAGVLLGAYGLLSRGKLSGQGSSFQLLNVVGSLLVGVNSLAHQAWPSVSVNMVWLVIGVATLVAAGRTSRRDATSAADVAATNESDECDADLPARTDSAAANVASSEDVPASQVAHPRYV